MLQVSLILVSLLGLIFLAFGTPAALASPDSLPLVLLLLFFFCTSSVTLCYLVEKRFRDPSLALLVILCGSVIAGAGAIIFIIMLNVLYYSAVS